MKIRCRIDKLETDRSSPNKRKVVEDEEVVPSWKRRWITETGKSVSKVEVRSWSSEQVGANSVMWADSIKALEKIGAHVSELTGAVKISEQTQKYLLEEVRQMVWVQDQTQGMVHVVAKWLEGFDGVVSVLEKGSELEKSGENMMKRDKGKGKEILEGNNIEESGESEESEGSEVEDVMKGLEISTLDADESMGVEK